MDDFSCRWAWFIRLIIVEMVAQSVGNIMAESENIVGKLGGKFDWLEVHKNDRYWKPQITVPQRIAVLTGDPKRKEVERVMWDFIRQFADAANSVTNSNTQ